MPVSKAHANWNGDIPTGSGQFSAGDGSISGGVTYKSRFEDGPGSNPEQLIAAWQLGMPAAELHRRAYDGEFAPAEPQDLRVPFA